MYVTGSDYPNDNLHGTVSVIDTTTNTVTPTIPACTFPGEVAVDPNTHTVYVASSDYSNSGFVLVIDTATNTVTRVIPVGVNLGGLAVDPSTQTIYVVDGNSSLNAFVSVIQRHAG